MIFAVRPEKMTATRPCLEPAAMWPDAPRGVRRLFSPQLFGRQARAFGHRFEFGPDDLRVADARSQPAVGAAHDVFPADNFAVAHETIGDRLGMLDNVGGMPDDAGHEDLAGGKF